MALTQRVLKNSVLLLVFQIVGLVFAFVTVPLLVRGLGPTSFGSFSAANAIIVIVTPFASLGLDQLVIREIARNPRYAAQFLFDSTFIKSIAAVAAIGVSLTVGYFSGISQDAMHALSILSLTLFLNSIINSATAFFYGQERMGLGSLIGLGLNIMNLVFVYWAFTQKQGIMAFAGAYVLGSGLMALFCLALLFPHYRRGMVGIKNWQSKLKLVKEGLPFIALALSLVVYYKVDILLLSALAGDTSVGIYSAAYRILDALMFLPAALMGALLPAVSSLSVAKRDDLHLILERGVRYLAMVGIPAAAGVSVLSFDIVAFLYGNGWRDSAINLRILIWAWGLIFINAMCPVVLNAIGQTMINVGVTVGGTVLNILLNLVLIPRLDTIGASYATVITEAFISIAYFLCVQGYIGRFLVLPYMVRPVIGSILMATLLSAMRFSNYGIWGIIAAIMLGSFSYMSSIVLLGGVDTRDWLLVKAIWHKITSHLRHLYECAINAYWY